MEDIKYSKYNVSTGYSYWTFANELDTQTCKKIIDLGKDKWQEAKFVKGGYNKTDEKVRVTEVVWLNDQWLFDVVFSYMNHANANSGWNFKIDTAEAMQLTKYPKAGHYHFHQDGNGVQTFDEPKNQYLNNKARKISMSIILNNEYEGGEFEFFGDPQLIKEKKGTILTFPSYQVHRVRPITKGTRYSLVVWFLGEPFK